jgi:hypothetical protein
LRHKKDQGGVGQQKWIMRRTKASVVVLYFNESLVLTHTDLVRKVRAGWESLGPDKQRATRLLLTKKVKMAIQPSNADTDPVENQFANSLDDILDDPDFVEVLHSNH